MRRSFDGLSLMVRNIIGQNPLSGHIFVFINKKTDRLKLLYWDRDGFAIWYKRLEKGTFTFPSADHDNGLLNHRKLSMLLEGVDISSVRFKKRFKFQKT